METLRLILIFLHMIGLAALLGGYLTQLSAGGAPAFPRIMQRGAELQFLTGVALIGVRQALHSDDEGEWPVDHAKWGVKLLVLVVIFALLANGRRKEPMPAGFFHAVGLLAIVNIAIATFW
jgi:hypothetical protein